MPKKRGCPAKGPESRLREPIGFGRLRIPGLTPGALPGRRTPYARTRQIAIPRPEDRESKMQMAPVFVRGKVTPPTTTAPLADAAGPLRRYRVAAEQPNLGGSPVSFTAISVPPELSRSDVRWIVRGETRLWRGRK